MARAGSEDIARPDKTLILSPLLNLPPGQALATAIVQHVNFRPMPEPCAMADATLSLGADRRTLSVTLNRPPGDVVGIRVRRLGELSSESADPADAHLRVIEVTSLKPGARRAVLRARLVLSGARSVQCLSPDDHAPLSLTRIEEIRPQSILGLTVGPLSTFVAGAPAAHGAAPGAENELRYLRRRLRDELQAAIGATQTVSTSRHAELANLYARAVLIEALRFKEG